MELKRADGGPCRGRRAPGGRQNAAIRIGCGEPEIEPKHGTAISRGDGEAFRRYRTFCRSYGGNELYCIAGGADVADYRWTEGVMKTAAFAGSRRLMDGISLHYYTQPNTWEHKKRAKGPA